MAEDADIALVATALGVVFGANVSLLAADTAGLLCLGETLRPVLVYASLVAVFHFLEYYMTARAHGGAGVYAFLLNHSRAYWAGMVLPLVEHTVCSAFGGAPLFRVLPAPLCVALGLVLAAAGQAMRTAAMRDAGPAFTHMVADEHAEGHVLVTTGVYAMVRHPSYAGFFAWVVGLQILLGNVVSPLLLAVVMHRFFSARIRDEEAHLVRFFGRAYLAYRRGRPSGVPFIS